MVVQHLVGSLKMPSDGSNNLIFLDQVKRHCAHRSWIVGQVDNNFSKKSKIAPKSDKFLAVNVQER